MSLKVAEGEPRRAKEHYSGYAAGGAEDLPQWDASLSSSRILLVLPLLQMGFPGQTTTLLCLSLVLLLWSQVSGVQGQEFQFGPCRVEGVVLQELWEAFRAMKDIVVSEVVFWTQLWGFL